MSASVWTDDMVALLRTLFAQGYAYSKIAAVITATHGVSVTRSAALGKATRLGLTRRSLSDPASRNERRSQNAKAGARTRRAEGSLPPVRIRPFTPRPIVAGPKAIPFDQATHITCKFPVSGEGVFLIVCGEPATHGPYCENCARVAYQPRAA